MGQLYKLDFPSGKSYIGITLYKAEDRVRRSNDCDSMRPICRAITKFGVANVKIEVLAETNSWDELCWLEMMAIAGLGTMAPAGYNITAGGDGTPGVEITKERRAGISAKLKGVPKSAAARAAMSKAQRGVAKKWTPEWKEAIRAANRGAQWNVGAKRSAETKQKQSLKKATWWSSMTAEQRSEFCARRALAQKEKKSESVHHH